MKKNFLLLLLMTLLPLAGWATVRITVTLGTINKVYGEPDPAVTELDFSWTKDGGGTTTEVTAANLLHALDYRRVSAGDEVNSVKYYTMVANSNKPADWILVIANQGVVNIMPKSLGTGNTIPNTGITIEDITGISFTNEAKTPALAVNYTKASFNENLVKDRDYTVEWANNINAGTATATLTGKGNYEGSVVKEFTIAARSLANVTIADIPDQTFAWDDHNVAIAQTPGITVTDAELGTTLVAGTDYVMLTDAEYTDGYKDNYNAGTGLVRIVGKGNYDDTTTADASFTINPMSIVDAEGNLINGFGLASTAAAEGLVYTGAALTPSIAFRCHGTSANVTANRIATYDNNINATTAESKATLTWTGIKNLTGSYTFKFDIAQRPVEDLTFDASLVADETYTGSQITKTTEGMVTYGALPALVAGTDFDVVNGANLNVGTAAGSTAFSFKGNYSGNVTKNFNITPATLTVNAKDFTKDLGNADPTSDALAAGNYYELTGFVNGETATTAEVTGAPTFAIAAHTEAAGTKDDVISIATVGTLAAANYSFAIGATADLIINKAGVAITVTDAEQTYGYKLPTLDKDAFAFTATGLLGAEEITDLTFTVKKGAIEYAKDDMLEAGEYDIIASNATATSGSYVFNYVAGTLTINKKAIKVVAKPQTVAYGGDAALDKDLLGGTTWSNTLVELQDTEGNTIGKTAFTNTYGIWKENFVANLTWEAEDGYADKPIAHPGFIVANPADYNTDNWDVIFVPGAVTYSSVATDLTLTRVAKADIDVATVAADIATYDGCEHMNVTIKFNDPGYNTLKPNKWYAFILPFKTDVKMISDAFGYAIVDLLNEGNTNSHRTVFSLKMDNAEIPANTPFIVKVWKTIDMKNDGVTFKDVKIEAPATYDEIVVSDAAGNQFIGSYTGIDGLGAYKPGYDGHVLWWSLNQASENDNDARPASKTGYLRQMSAFSYVPEDVAAHEFIIEELGGNTTVIRGINIDGQNISAEGWYNLNGVKLQGAPTEKGVYIQNGKKIVIK